MDQEDIVSLENLGAQINNAIDDLADDKPADPSPAPPADPTAAAPTAPEEKAPEAPPPAPLPDFSKKPKAAADPATPADPKAPPPVEAAPDLSKYPEGYRKMLAKFVPGGEIKTQADLDAAVQKASDDYWRNQTRLAELAKETPSDPAAPPAPQPKPATPAELQSYDQGLQQLQTKGAAAQNNIKGWENEIAKITGEIRTLENRKTRGDATLDPEDLVAAYQQLRQAEANRTNWENHFEELREQNNSLRLRRQEAESLLDVRSRLDRQAQEQGEREENARMDAFRSTFDSTLAAVLTEEKVTAEDKADLTELVRARVHMQAGVKPFGEGELKPFIAPLVKAYVKRINDAAAKAVEGYTKKKTSDAPMVPASKSRVATQDKASTQAPNLRNLERAIMEADIDG